MASTTPRREAVVILQRRFYQAREAGSIPHLEHFQDARVHCRVIGKEVEYFYADAHGRDLTVVQPIRYILTIAQAA